MNNMLSTINEAFNVLLKDKVILLFSLVPVLIGAILYSLLWGWMFGDVMDSARSWIEQQVSTGGWSSVFYYILVGILMIGFWFILSWTFVLIVSIIASPFNDMISSRTEKIIGGESPQNLSESIGLMLKNLFNTIFNEIKKVVFIITCSLLAFLLSLIPLLVPISIAISALLMASSFLDYSWGRHNLSFRECLKDVRTSFLPFGLSGAFFLILVSIPVINLFALSYGTIYYTILYVQENKAENS